MPIITLTSDWSTSDFYVGAIKGKILSRIKDSCIIDISHNIQSFNTAQAAFVLRNAFPNFPEGTIHLVFVNTEPSADRPFLAVKAHGHYFIGSDNGIFSLVSGEHAEKIVKIRTESVKSYSAFDIFCASACALAEGADIAELGETVDSFNIRIPYRPTIENSTLTGSVIYIDTYQNAITNISKDLFDKIAQERSFDIYVQSKHYKISVISNFYHEVPVGEILATFNSVGLLEIAINNGNAARLLNLDTNSTVRVEFSDRKK
jgi:S-adenosylmethionine hydrolase